MSSARSLLALVRNNVTFLSLPSIDRASVPYRGLSCCLRSVVVDNHAVAVLVCIWCRASAVLARLLHGYGRNPTE